MVCCARTESRPRTHAQVQEHHGREHLRLQAGTPASATPKLFPASRPQKEFGQQISSRLCHLVLPLRCTSCNLGPCHCTIKVCPTFSLTVLHEHGGKPVPGCPETRLAASISQLWRLHNSLSPTSRSRRPSFGHVTGALGIQSAGLCARRHARDDRSTELEATMGQLRGVGTPIRRSNSLLPPPSLLHFSHGGAALVACASA